MQKGIVFMVLCFSRGIILYFNFLTFCMPMCGKLLVVPVLRPFHTTTLLDAHQCEVMRIDAHQFIMMLM